VKQNPIKLKGIVKSVMTQGPSSNLLFKTDRIITQKITVNTENVNNVNHQNLKTFVEHYIQKLQATCSFQEYMPTEHIPR
jgi:hypothetical protein